MTFANWDQQSRCALVNWFSSVFMKRKHKIARIKAGLYNYRGYNILKQDGAWVVLGEDDSVVTRKKTLRAMRRELDACEQCAAKHGWR